MKKPFLVVITFKSGQLMHLEERTRTRALNVAQNYRDLETVEGVRLYTEITLDSI